MSLALLDQELNKKHLRARLTIARFLGKGYYVWFLSNGYLLGHNDFPF